MMVMHTHFADLDARLVILSQVADDSRLTYVVTLDSETSNCLKCQHGSHKRHSAYMRIIDHLPIQGKRVQLYLKTRKWFCTNALCETKVCLPNGSNGCFLIASGRSVWIKCCAR